MQGEAGFALISVIWIVLFLALAAASFTMSVRTHVRETSAEAASAEARALADAGANLALHDLLNARQMRAWQRRFPADGRAFACGIGNGRVAVTVEDEAGKIDLNAAPETLLRRLISGLGVPGEQAARLAAAIVDYRDGDGDRSPGGAEAEAYQQAGRTLGPKNAPFTSPLELAQVLGFDAGLLARMAPLVTVHSGQQGIDVTKASPRLMAAIAADGATGFQSRFPAEFRVGSAQRMFTIRAEAQGERGATFAREMVVRLAPSRSRLYSVLAWRQVGAGGGAAPTEHGPC